MWYFFLDMKVMAVCNQKGGVGKTTTAINLSACLAALGLKTLLIDIDPQGNASSGLGYGRGRVERNIYSALLGDVGIRGLILKTGLEGLNLVPATIDLIGAEVELISMPNRERRLKRALLELGPARPDSHREAGGEEYSYIIIDCPPSLGLLTINALTAAHSVLIPLQCEYFAMEGLASLTETLRMVIRSLNPRLTLEGILLTMFDPRNNLSHQVSAEVRRHFGDKVLKTVIPRNVRLSESTSFGKPVILYDPRCRGAESYQELAKEIVGRGLGGTL